MRIPVSIAGFIFPILIAYFSVLADTTCATGSFLTNTPSIIKATPVSLIQGSTPDTTYTFRTSAGALSVTYSLPVSIDNTGIAVTLLPKSAATIRTTGSCVILQVPAAWANQSVRAYTFTGRIVYKQKIDNNGFCRIDLAGHATGCRILTVGDQIRVPAGYLMHGAVIRPGSRAPEVSAGRHAVSTAVYKVDVEAIDKDLFSVITARQISLSPGANSQISFELQLLKDTTAAGKFKELFPETLYNTFFAKRYGLGKLDPKSDGKFDFFTYSSFVQAVAKMSEIVVEVWIRSGLNYCYKGKWKNKKTGETREFVTHPDYNSNWAQQWPETKYATVDYATFSNDGNDTLRKRELCAFLGNISHETTGMGAQDTAKLWGLYWREEVEWQLGSTALGYVDNSDVVYPPAPGKSYHGRGPIQISWNYNYGQVSEFLYGDKNILLKNPEKVLGDTAVVSFMTAIWFWMTPQNPKPSCHDVMVERWKPNATDIANGRDKSRFGNTVNIINGNLECGNNNPTDDRVTDRIGFYKRYARLYTVSTEANCGCYNMKPY